MAPRRPADLCRSWLFLEGANEAVLQRAAQSGADVLIQELEDFTPPTLRPQARALAAELYVGWRAAVVIARHRHGDDALEEARMQPVHIAADDEHLYWRFNGEYWKDELGYYRFRVVTLRGRVLATGFDAGLRFATTAVFLAAFVVVAGGARDVDVATA